MITALNSKTKVISLHSYNKSLVDKCSNSIIQSLISEDSSPNLSVNPSLCSGDDDNVIYPHRVNVNTKWAHGYNVLYLTKCPTHSECSVSTTCSQHYYSHYHDHYHRVDQIWPESVKPRVGYKNKLGNTFPRF